MSSETITAPLDADLDPLRLAVDAAAGALAADGRLAGPAAPQDDAESLLPGGVPVGVWSELSDGSAALVLAAAEVLVGPGAPAEPEVVVEALSPILEALAREAGLTLGPVLFTDAAPIPAVFDPAGGGTLVGAGVFEGESVVASVAAITAARVAAAPVASTTVPTVPSLPNLGLLVDVELGVTVELGRSTVSMGSLLDLRPGSVLELDRAAGSAVDILVNGTLLGRGEVIVVENSYAVRITEIVADGVER